MAESWRNRLPPILAGLSLIAAWQGIISGFDIPTYIAPGPLEVLQTFWQEAGILGRNLLPTLMESVVGFICGNLIAILIAIIFVHSRLAEKAFFSHCRVYQYDSDTRDCTDFGADLWQRLYAQNCDRCADLFFPHPGQYGPWS